MASIWSQNETVDEILANMEPHSEIDPSYDVSFQEPDYVIHNALSDGPIALEMFVQSSIGDIFFRQDSFSDALSFKKRYTRLAPWPGHGPAVDIYDKYANWEYNGLVPALERFALLTNNIRLMAVVTMDDDEHWADGVRRAGELFQKIREDQLQLQGEQGAQTSQSAITEDEIEFDLRYAIRYSDGLLTAMLQHGGIYSKVILDQNRFGLGAMVNRNKRNGDFETDDFDDFGPTFVSCDNKSNCDYQCCGALPFALSYRSPSAANIIIQNVPNICYHGRPLNGQKKTARTEENDQNDQNGSNQQNSSSSKDLLSNTPHCPPSSEISIWLACSSKSLKIFTSIGLTLDDLVVGSAERVILNDYFRTLISQSRFEFASELVKTLNHHNIQLPDATVVYFLEYLTPRKPIFESFKGAKFSDELKTKLTHRSAEFQSKLLVTLFDLYPNTKAYIASNSTGSLPQFKKNHPNPDVPEPQSFLDLCFLKSPEMCRFFAQQLGAKFTTQFLSTHFWTQIISMDIVYLELLGWLHDELWKYGLEDGTTPDHAPQTPPTLNQQLHITETLGINIINKSIYPPSFLTPIGYSTLFHRHSLVKFLTSFKYLRLSVIPTRFVLSASNHNCFVFPSRDSPWGGLHNNEEAETSYEPPTPISPTSQVTLLMALVLRRHVASNDRNAELVNLHQGRNMLLPQNQPWSDQSGADYSIECIINVYIDEIIDGFDIIRDSNRTADADPDFFQVETIDMSPSIFRDLDRAMTKRRWECDAK